MKKTMLLSIFCALLTLNESKAAVTLTFAQEGSNVTATWSGFYNIQDRGLPLTGVWDSTPWGGAGAQVTPSAAYGFAEASVGFNLFEGGALDTFAIFGVYGGTASSYSGVTFGFSMTDLFYPVALVGFSGDFFPTGVMTFENTTLEELGVADFNNTLAFVGNDNVGGNREIRFTTIPEPSHALLLTLGGIAGLLVRKRPWKKPVR